MTEQKQARICWKNEAGQEVKLPPIDDWQWVESWVRLANLDSEGPKYWIECE